MTVPVLGSHEHSGSPELGSHAFANSATVSVGRSGDQRVDGELQAIRWESSSLSYSFPKSLADYDYSVSGFSPFSAQQASSVRTILEGAGAPGYLGFSLEGLTNLSFTQVGSPGADLRYANTTETSTAYAYYPEQGIYGGDSWYGGSGKSPVQGNYHHHTLMHETGHALGLKHGQEASVYGSLPNATNSMEFSVMTYRSYVGSGGTSYSNEKWGYAQSYMMNDIAALQHMYGANYGTNSGNTVYAWNQGTGVTYVNGDVAIAPGGNRIFETVWDGGGTDTYDLSGYTSDLVVNLAPGGYSTFSTAQVASLGGGHFARGNVFNALLHRGDARSLIENATGGLGSDSITGNATANLLSGGEGNDTLSGVNGSDLLLGDGGRDRLSGGGGADALDGGAGSDTLEGGVRADRLTGGADADLLIGGAGNDVFVFNANGSTVAARDIIAPSGAAAAFQGAGRGAGDRIDLSGLDADTTKAGMQDWVLGTSHAKGQLWTSTSGGQTILSGNVDDDAAIEFQLAIDDGGVAASAYRVQDFIL